MFDRISILGALGVIAGASAAWAHPGHGEVGAGTAAHYMNGPVHGTAAIVALIVVAMFVARVVRAVSARRTGGSRAEGTAAAGLRLNS